MIVIDKVYPIYRFEAKWSQDGIQDLEYPNLHIGLPEGRIWNGTGFKKMFKEEQTQEQLNKCLNEWWKKYSIQKDFECKNISDLKLTVEYYEHETWFLTWFCHETFDEGQTDEEVLDSFEYFVRRKEDINSKSNKTFDEYPLMGADDRWRWHSTLEEGEYLPAPCRCKHCKEQGVVRIAH